MEHEVTESRQRLRDTLGISELLEQRSIIKLAYSGVHCEVYGASNASPKGIVVFLPGIGTYCELYAEMLSHVADEGYLVVGVDYPGHGYSDGNRGLFTVQSVTDAVTELLDMMLSAMDLPVFVWGYSIGSLLGLAVAESDTRVKALLCGTLILPDVPPDPSYTMGWWFTHQQAWFFPSLKVPLRMFVDLPTLLAAHPASHLISRDDKVVFDYPLKTLSSIYGYHSSVAREALGFRATIVHGELDEVLPVGYSRRLAAQLPHSFDLVALKGVGHMAPWLSTDVYARAVVDWLEAANIK